MQHYFNTLLALVKEAVKLSMTTHFDAWVKAEEEKVFMIFTVEEYVHVDNAVDGHGFPIGEGEMPGGYYIVTEINALTFIEDERIVFVLAGK